MALVNDAGRMRGRCTFIVKKEVENSRGTVNIVDEDLFTCWYAPVQHNIRDIHELTGTGHSARKTIIIRSRQKFPIDNSMRVRIKNVVYEIDQIIFDIEHEEFDTIVLQDKS